jgi:SAM-dependent methyltransferase
MTWGSWNAGTVCVTRSQARIRPGCMDVFLAALGHPSQTPGVLQDECLSISFFGDLGPVDMSLRSVAAQVARRVLGRYVASRKRFRAQIEGKFGLEIGGPSSAFGDSGELPLYRFLAGLDNCVFSVETIWEGRRAEGLTYSYHPNKAKGFNFVREATDLQGIADHTYDFVLSSHNLEHISNPIRALKEWTRVVKPGGAIIVLLPDYRRTFDHRRKPTPIEHMLEDYELTRDETDLTHLEEILELHDLSRDPGGVSNEHFRQRSLRNFENRCLHHHVFDERNSRELFEAIGLTVQVLELVKPLHIAILALCPPIDA